ncbi:MAG: isocitrate lyase/phosphoenolpyruvate mutase family protein [Candidatus Eremiobacteraeota bacterium]|nr:isocitrate lyase/phosphoenolpyruvate mutase family protein [Candidatus Eremiobacteraeota bacterium]
MTTTKDRAEHLRALHQTAKPLVLVNAWDAVSARIVEELGFPAVATTSAGIAWAEGFADGQHISRDAMLERVRRIVQSVHVPVTADLEGGYGTTVADAVATARGAIDAGAAGLNFEDAHQGELIDADLHASRVAAMRDAATKLGVPLVINARTDIYLENVGDNDDWRLQEAVRRGNQYLGAGADVIFVPGVTDEATIAALVSGIHGQINVLAGATTPSVRRLHELGVARVSVGSGAMGYALARYRDVAATLRDKGTFEFTGQRIPHAELNALFNSAKAAPSEKARR